MVNVIYTILLYKFYRSKTNKKKKKQDNQESKLDFELFFIYIRTKKILKNTSELYICTMNF